MPVENFCPPMFSSKRSVCPVVSFSVPLVPSNVPPFDDCDGVGVALDEGLGDGVGDGVGVGVGVGLGVLSCTLKRNQLSLLVPRPKMVSVPGPCAACTTSTLTIGDEFRSSARTDTRPL